jgi:RNA polymerase sporulation-specific sigma factor
MNYQEIESCVIRAKSGNQEDLLKLIEQFKPFIVKTANQFTIKNHDIYDLLQIGYITLINAVSKYKVGSHTFSSYAFNAIKNNLRYVGRKHANCGEELSLNMKVDTEGDAATEFVDCILDEEDIENDFISREQLEDLRKAVASLPEDELELVVMIFYDRIPLKTYAQKKDLSYFLAKRKKEKILEKLRLQF